MRNLTKKGFFLSNKIGKAIADYKLIEDNDRIIVAVSGGKDSLALLKLLLERQRWAPVSFELLAVHVITDFDRGSNTGRKTLEGIFKDWNCRYRFIELTLQNGKKADISCFWCSWNRRKALFKLASELGYNKIALAHHKDDIVETILLNLFFNGEISSINAKQPLFNGKITIIRPFVYVEEKAISLFAKESGFPLQSCECPNAGMSRRTIMKRLISEIEKGCTHVKSNIFRAPCRIRGDYLGRKEAQNPLSARRFLSKAKKT